MFDEDDGIYVDEDHWLQEEAVRKGRFAAFLASVAALLVVGVLIRLLS